MCTPHRHIEEQVSGRHRKDSCMTLGQHVYVAILAGRVHVAGRIHRGHVDAPFKSVRIRSAAGDRTTRTARATLGIGALELPLNIEFESSCVM